MVEFDVNCDTILSRFRTFDLVLFRGSDFVSNTIAKMEKTQVGVDTYTHAGLVIRADDMPTTFHVDIPGVCYVLESTASGPIIDGVPSVVDGSGHFGVQLRNLGDVIRQYQTRLAWLPLAQHLRPAVTPHLVEFILRKYLRHRYNMSFVNLLAAITPCMRRVRDDACFRRSRSCFCRTFCCGSQPNTWLFCSELCAQVYKDIGVFPPSVRPENVLPVDFLPKAKSPAMLNGWQPSITTIDADCNVPWVFDGVTTFFSHVV